MTTEAKIGTVTDYYGKIGVAAIHLTDGELRVGDRVRLKGHTTDFIQTAESIQIEHQPVEHAARGTEIALKVRERVRRHDEVLRVTEG